MNNTTINNTLNSNIDIANIRTQHREILTKKNRIWKFKPMNKKKKKKKKNSDDYTFFTSISFNRIDSFA